LRAVPDLHQRTLALRTATRCHRTRLPAPICRSHPGPEDAAVITGTPMTHKIAVLFGGPTPEHEVSLGSARSVLAQLQLLGWDALAVGISKDGRWFVGPGALDRVLARADPTRLPLGVVPAADRAS